MGSVASQQRIASAYVVFHGCYGDVCRQWVYREATRVREVLTHQPGELQRLRAEVRQLRQDKTELQQRLRRAVVLDAAKQAEVARVGQAMGVTLRDCRALLQVMIPGQVLSVATLGRRTQGAGKQAGPLLAVLDAFARPRVREAAADEIYVKDPVLMVVEPDSLCWLSGRLSDAVSGAAWEQELAALPLLEQVTRDGGHGSGKRSGVGGRPAASPRAGVGRGSRGSFPRLMGRRRGLA